MVLSSWFKSLALFSVATFLFASALPAGQSPEEIGDIAPQGEPDGVVDDEDVELALRAIAGDVELDPASIERADTAPVVELEPPGNPPQRVRPNPNPTGPLDIGDAVIIARRAAGLIVFDQLNQPPSLTLFGDGDVVSVAEYAVTGMVTDDLPIEGGTVDLTAGDTVIEGVAITPDGPSALEGTFAIEVTLRQGANEFTVRPRDAEQRLGLSETIEVFFDTEPPALEVTAPEDWFITNLHTVEVSGTASDESGVQVWANGVEALHLPPDLWGATVPLQIENENVIEVVAHDGATPPNETSTSLTVIRDTTPPVLTPDALPVALGIPSFVLSGTVSDAWGIDSVLVNGQQASIDWDPATQSGRFFAEVPVLDGENEFEIEAIDIAGNRTVKGPFVVLGDFVFPEVTLVSPAFVSETPTDITLGFSKPAFMEYFGSRTFSPPLFVDVDTYTLEDVHLEEGPNTFEVLVRDIAGNITRTDIVVTLDTIPPVVSITRVHNPNFQWRPEGGLHNVITNAPTAIVEGVVLDDGGIAVLEVNGYEATIDADGTFTVAGVRLLPRRNTITATATDNAGHVGSDSVLVRRDAEGPVVSLNLDRAAYVTTLDPPPSPFDTTPLPVRHYRGAQGITVSGTASDPFYTWQVETLAVRLNGEPLSVTGAPPYQTFSFTIPAAAISAPGVQVLEVESTDGLGNRTVDAQAMLAGQWITPMSPIMNSVGVAAGPAALKAMEPMFEEQVTAMHPLVLDPRPRISNMGVSFTIYGIGFCRPPGDPRSPPYNCTPVVYITLGLTAGGDISLRVQMPMLYVGIRTDACFYRRDGHIRAQNTVIDMRLRFRNTAEGVRVEEIPGSVDVNIGSLRLQTNHSCADGLLAIAQLFVDIEKMVEDAFEDQVPELLDAVNDILAEPLMTDDDTGMELWLARGFSDSSAIRLWMDAKGDPCPSPLANTSMSDDEGNKIPCPPDSPRLAPGSFAGTPNHDLGTLPALDLEASDGSAVSAQAAANDDFINYMLHEQWAMGALDLTIDQSLLGEDAPITLDTDALSLFIPDLRRSDVVAEVPVGSPVAIETSMPLPPVLTTLPDGSATYQLAVGEMEWRVMANADGDAETGFETHLFTAAVTLKASAGIWMVPAETDDVDDMVVIDVGTPVAFTDVVLNPHVINEASIRSTVTNLINLALPMLTGEMTQFPLPANTARFVDAHIDGPQEDYLVLSGDLIHSVAVTGPPDGEPISDEQIVIEGTVTGLSSAPAAVHLWLPGDTTGRQMTVRRSPSTSSSLSFSYELDVAELELGENSLRVVAVDTGTDKRAVLDLTLDRTASDVTRSGGSDCIGCDSAASNGGRLAIFLAFALLVLFFRPRRGRRGVLGSSRLAAGSAAIMLAFGAGCGGGGCGEPPPDAPPDEEMPLFTGSAVSADPVFIVSELQIGGPDDGFDVNEDNPGPDNALHILGPLANSELEKAMAEGTILLLVQLQGIANLPAPGESGQVDAIAFLGVDLDDDPSNNFSGHETFAKDPASFDENGDPLIVFSGTTLRGLEDGTVTLMGGPATFNLAVPMDDSVLELQIAPTYIAATLGVSSLREDGVEATDGLLGGVVPAGPLATPIEGLGFAPLSILVSELDVDLNGDGEIDRRVSPENEDGLSAGILFAAVPAFLTDEPVNLPPVVSIDALPEDVTTPVVEVKGTVHDPDGNCLYGRLVISVNGGDPFPAALSTGADDVCTFSEETVLALGRNTIRATATDTDGDTGTAQIATRLVDETPPEVALHGPTGVVDTREQVVTGVATDNVGLHTVQLDVSGALLTIPAEDLDEDGAFAVTVSLPNLGANVITAVAIDLAENVSQPATLEVVFEDTEPPTIEFTAASTIRERREGAGPWLLTAGDVLIEGTVDDNAGLDDLMVSWVMVRGDTRGTVSFDRETGAFELPLSLPLGGHALRIVAEDAAGNFETLDGTINIRDRQAPSVDVVAPSPITHEQHQELVLRVTDDWEEPRDITVTAGALGETLAVMPFDEATGTFRRPLTLALGDNPLVIEATDTAGNRARVQGVIELVDIEPPVLDLGAPDNDFWTFEETVTVTGRATDNIGPVSITVEVGDFSASVEPGNGGAFSLEVPLKLGVNGLNVFAIDGAGLVSQKSRRVERLDPDAVGQVALTLEPSAVAIGNDTPVVVTAVLDRLAGGPVPEGTQVHFRAGPEGLGVISDVSATTEGGVARTVFQPGRTVGLVTLTAESQLEEGSASLSILMPSAVVLDVCLAEEARGAGFSFELEPSEDASFEASAPSSDATEAVGLAESFHVYNRAAIPTMVLLAGVEEIVGEADGSLMAQLTWPLRGGFASLGEVLLRDARASDVLGDVSEQEAALEVCGLEHLIGGLPPRVALTPIATPTTTAEHVLSGTVEAEDLASCEAVLIHNGHETPLDVGDGAISYPITLEPGSNQIRVLVTDSEGRQGADEIQVRYNAPNQPPVVAITSPGPVVTETSVVVEGEVSDEDDGLVGMVVTVRVGTSPAVQAVIDIEAGTFRAPVTLQQGNNLITVTATDARGASTVVSQTTAVMAPVAPPRITLTAPTQNEVFTSPSTGLSGRVDDGGNPATITVTMTVNDAPQPITFSPFSRELSATLSLSPGSNVIVVTATDITEQRATATRTVTYQAPNSPPRVTITWPANNAKLFTDTITVRGTVRDNMPLNDLASFKVNGVDASVDTATGNWTAEVTLPKGASSIDAVAVDGGGLSGEASASVEFYEPVMVVNYLQIGGQDDGFDVSSNPPHPLSKAGPDNALAGLAPVANGPLLDQIQGKEGEPLLLLFEIVGLVELPAMGQSVTVDVVGYIGIDPEDDPSNNFSGDAAFEIDPKSYDEETGEPILYIADVTITNQHGNLRINTFPDHPSRFEVSVDSTDPPLTLTADPAYVRTTLGLGPKGLSFNPGLLGGVIPAATLAFPISMGDLEIVPLELLISDDPANPCPDVDLNHSGYVNTWDATASNPDGVSVGLVFTAVPASIIR